MCVNSLQISEFILNVCFPFGGEADYHIWCRIIDWLLVLNSEKWNIALYPASKLSCGLGGEKPPFFLHLTPVPPERTCLLGINNWYYSVHTKI